MYKLYNLDEQFIKEADHYSNNFSGIVEINGWRYWFLSGKVSRENQPAVIYSDNSHKEWRTEGKHHRLDGPAIESNRGNLYYVDGKRVTKQQHELLQSIMKLKGLI